VQVDSFKVLTSQPLEVLQVALWKTNPFQQLPNCNLKLSLAFLSPWHGMPPRRYWTGSLVTALQSIGLAA